ncbi:MAG: hypothetical protein GQE15_35950 [Archangiaceae bacterium]|nr:hypothetical protein [Archangiaceae bacterium]
MRALLLGVLVFSVACGTNTGSVGNARPDSGSGSSLTGGGIASAGGGSSGGGTAGGGSAQGGGSTSTGQATITVASAPRRGPIAVAVRSMVDGWELRVRSDGGTKTATLLRGSTRDGGVGELTWQSFDDVASNERVQLEVVSGGTLLGFAPVDLRNDPATARLVTIGHPLLQLDGGGVTARHTEITVGQWNGTALTGTRRLTTGMGPNQHRAAPHGRATVVVEDTSGSLSIIETPLDANPLNARVLHAGVKPPMGEVIDARFSHDGRHLYVVGSAPQGSSDYRLWRFTPSEDLSTLGTGTLVAEIPGPSLRFDVEAESGRVLLPVGPGLQNRPERVMVFDPYDAARSHVTPVTIGGATGFAASPRGGLLLVSDEVFMPGLSLISLSSSASNLVMRNTVIGEPADIVFHPDSDGSRGVALVSQPFRNRATPVVVSPTGVTLGTAVTGLPLGSSSDMIMRGPWTGTVFITCVTELFRVQVDGANGTATNQGMVIDFGGDATDQAQGVAIQR